MKTTAEKDFSMMALQKRSQSRTGVKRVFKIYDSVVKAKLGVQFLLGCIAVIRNPFDTDRVIMAAQSMVTPERFEESQEHIRSIPGAIELFNKKPLLTFPDLRDLAKLPEGTFGRAYAKHMLDNKLDPNFYDLEFNDDVSYSFYRYGKVHDVWHVATGFDTTVRGEIGILAFSYAQLHGPGAMLIASLVFLHGVLVKPRELWGYIESFIRGFELGRDCKPLYTVDWIAAFKQPLQDVRAMLDIPVGGIDPKSTVGRVAPLEISY